MGHSYRQAEWPVLSAFADLESVDTVSFLEPEEGLATAHLIADKIGPHKDEWLRCARDTAYWIDTYVWTYNPKLLSGDRWIRFKLFPKQRECVGWIRDRQLAKEDGIIEKSREVGMTWLVIAVLVHDWLFEDGFKGAVGSRKEDLVDRLGDPDCILEKGRMILRKLPEWMLPAGFDEKKHCGHMKFINPANGSAITGEAGDNIGRGGRNGLYILDEAAFIERPERVDAALSENCDVKIKLSTPNGQGNTFAVQRHSGAFPVFTFHWRDDPRKDDAWYEDRCSRLDPVIVAQEIDIDYTASVDGICIPAKYVRAAIDLDLPRSERIVAGGDVAAGGKNKSTFVARAGPVVLQVKQWPEANTTITAHNFAQACRDCGAAIFCYDAIGVGSGVRSTFELMDALPFQPVAILSGESPTQTKWPDGRTSQERFLNLRAELWWLARTRFEKTYEYSLWLSGKDGGHEHPLDELISIPRGETELITQLSLPLALTTQTGKIKIESKQDMAKRGIKSPDLADAFVYSLFAPKIQRWAIL